MSTASTRLEYLFRGYYQKKLTSEERSEFIDLLNRSQDDEALKRLIQEVLQNETGEMVMDDENASAVLAAIVNADKKATVVKLFNWKRWVAAAAITGIIAIGAYLFIAMPHKGEKQAPEIAVKGSDVPAPDKTKATLTLADGRIIAVDSLTTLTEQNVQLIKTSDGKLVYSPEVGKSGSQEIVYNTLSNPRGSKVIDMMLADSSHVWLNAGSSVTYPVAFIGNERKVSITGEAYFEVTHDASKPFSVSKGEVSVQVLGTHFNVNAYDDEPDIKVTLLEGSVKTSMGNGQSAILKPGEQAIVDPIHHSPFTTHQIDVEQVMAWKNGLFSFQHADLQTVMKQLSRWYDVDVVYEGKISQQQFEGKMQRDLLLSQVLKILQKSEVHFRIEETTAGVKRIIVTQ